MRRVFNRLSGLLVILVMLGWTSPAPLIALSKTSRTAPGAWSRRAKTVTYLALGDSTGVGLGAQNGYGYVERLMTRIQKKHPRSRLVKLCRFGETTAGLRGQLTDGFPVKPTFVTLSIGINDLFQQVSDEQFAENYEEIVKSLRRLAVPIVVTNLPDITSAPSLPNSIREEIRVKLLRFNQRIEALAKRYGLLFVNLYEASRRVITRHTKLFSSDGFHPSDAGYKFWTQTMWPQVKIAIDRASKDSQQKISRRLRPLPTTGGTP